MLLGKGNSILGLVCSGGASCYAFNKGKYLSFVTYFQSLLYFEGFSTLQLRLLMLQFELGLSKSALQSPWGDARDVCCVSEMMYKRSIVCNVEGKLLVQVFDVVCLFSKYLSLSWALLSLRKNQLLLRVEVGGIAPLSSMLWLNHFKMTCLVLGFISLFLPQLFGGL